MEVLNILEIPSQSNLKFAPLWKRLVAVIVDMIILVTGFLVSLVVAGRLLSPILIERMTQASQESDIDEYYFITAVIAYSFGAILTFLYFTVLESSWKQGTLGKIIFGIRVGKANGEKISFINSSGRYFAKVLSIAILLIGCLVAVFDPKRQALHDKMASTYVFRR